MSIQERFTEQNIRTASDKLLVRLRDYGTSDETLKAIENTPRHIFVDCSISDAYVDKPILIGQTESTVSQPSVVSLMIDLLQVENDMTVLEVGTASGWNAGILSKLVSKVITVEINEDLAIKAQSRFKELGIDNIESIVGDGSDLTILSELVDRIMVTASVKPFYPFPPILRLLKYEGIAVLPLGGDESRPNECDLMVYQHTNFGMSVTHEQGGFNFVPMRGKFGWSE